MKRKLIILFMALTTCSIIPMYGNPQEEIDVARAQAIAAIDTEVGESSDANILDIAEAAKEEINKNLNLTDIANIKDLAIYKIRTVKDINTQIGDRTYQLFYNVVIGDRINLLKHAQKLTDAETIRIEIMGRLELAIGVYDSAKAEDLSVMGVPPLDGSDCTAVKVTKDGHTITLYAPESVKYIKIKK